MVSIRIEACYIPFCLCFQQDFRLRKDLINFSSGRRVRTLRTADNRASHCVGVRVSTLTTMSRSLSIT